MLTQCLQDSLQRATTFERHKTGDILDQDRLWLELIDKAQEFKKETVSFISCGPFGRIDREPLTGRATSDEIKLTLLQSQPTTHIASINQANISRLNDGLRVVQSISFSVTRYDFVCVQRLKSRNAQSFRQPAGT